VDFGSNGPGDIPGIDLVTLAELAAFGGLNSPVTGSIPKNAWSGLNVRGTSCAGGLVVDPEGLSVCAAHGAASPKRMQNAAV